MAAGRTPAGWRRPAPRRRAGRTDGRGASSSHSLVFDQAQVDLVLAFVALKDAHRGRYPVGDPENGFVVTAVGAEHPQRVVTEVADLHVLGGVGGPVFVAAHAAHID